MIDSKALLADLSKQLKTLEADIRTRLDSGDPQNAALQNEWQAARDAGRCAEPFVEWREQAITQASVHWLLACVFLRFVEDNELVERPWLSGPIGDGRDRLLLARDRHEDYFRAHPNESDREYLLACFREAEALPALEQLFDEAHNPVFRVGISGDAAMALLAFWQKVNPDTGTLLHDFTDPSWNTRFLGDLYQDLSEATRKRYALLQTPEFVEEFILDRTLTPAIHEFGFREVRMIDPTCGSGHFLLGGFWRLFDQWARHEPGRNPRDIAQRALDAVAGVDLNPFAVAVARFRLLIAALQAGDVTRLAGAPDFKVQLAVGDSLLHGGRFGLTATEEMFDQAEHFSDTGLAHAFANEDLQAVKRILGRQYHAVVGNPPYIVVKDAALNAAYRSKYASCHMKYSLGAPFTERFFELALTANAQRPAGYVGLITTNSFMKREFGSKLIEQVLPRLDLTHVIDTAGAYIPGHGTPTVILFGRHQAPIADTVRTVMGIKGEPSTPSDPARGLVWSAILEQIDRAGSESEFISVADTARPVFGKHPWSLGGGGASDVKGLIEASGSTTFGSKTVAMGFFGISAADEIMLADAASFRRYGVEQERVRPVISGDEVRDWSTSPEFCALFPYDDDALLPLEDMPGLANRLWGHRTFLGSRTTFSKRTYFEEGRPWWEWHQIALERIKTPLTITFAEVATHNHFVLDRGGKVFNRTAPVIKLPESASEDEHLGLLGLLNSSVACFWFKQVCHNKGSTVDQHGARQRTAPFEDFYALNSTKVAEFPLVDRRPTLHARSLDAASRELAERFPAALLRDESLPDRAALDSAKSVSLRIHRKMIARQEELDWHCYGLYGLLPDGAHKGEFEYHDEIEVALGERAFEIVLARRLAAGDEQTSWFERHGSTPITDIPSHWPLDYQRVVQRRIELIENDRNIGLVERPEYKRRWNSPTWESLEQAALRDWLLARLESPTFWPASADVPAALTSTHRLADAVRHDAAFMQVAALYAGHADFDLAALVAELVAAESVPFLPVLRYTESGLRKRAQWEETWGLQRREDAGENVGAIPVPPKYQSKDFLKTDCWRLRGGLDVPKERWVSYPHCERGADGSLVIAWAGWNYLQQATALAAYYLDMKEREGWAPARLQALLAGLQELVPWLKQWHNEYDAEHGACMGDYFASFVEDEARSLGFTPAEVAAWQPPATTARRGRRRAS